MISRPDLTGYEDNEKHVDEEHDQCDLRLVAKVAAAAYIRDPSTVTQKCGIFIVAVAQEQRLADDFTFRSLSSPRKTSVTSSRMRPVT